MPEQKISLEKSQELANHIIMIAGIIQTIDLDYLKLAAKELLKQAQWQESAAVLNPSYPQVKNELLYAQAQALSILSKYIEKLKEIDNLKGRTEVESDQIQKIHNLFM